MPDREPINWLREQAIRMRRIKWPNAWMLADELWLILSSLEPVNTGKITVSPSPGQTNNYTLPSLPSLNIPQLDLDIPDFGTIRPDNNQENVGGQTQNVKETCFWRRSTLLAVLNSVPEQAGQNCNVTFYPNGFLGSICTDMFELNPEDAYSWEDTAVCLNNPDGLEVGDYVLVYQVSQWKQTEVTLRDRVSLGIIDRQTELMRLQYQNMIVATGAGEGGSVGITLGYITALEGSIPGSGDVYLYKRNKETGALYSVRQVVAYSSVRVGIPQGKWIQLKKIDGDYWIDVEDCKDESEGT